MPINPVGHGNPDSLVTAKLGQAAKRAKASESPEPTTPAPTTRGPGRVSSGLRRGAAAPATTQAPAIVTGGGNEAGNARQAIQASAQQLRDDASRGILGRMAE